MKKTLRQCQRDQERETADHGVMVRELQTLLTTERNKCEMLEQQVEQIYMYSCLSSNYHSFSLMNLARKFSHLKVNSRI